MSASAAIPPSPAAAPPPTRLRRLADLLLGRYATLALAGLAAVLGIGSFALMSSGAPLSLRPNLVTALVLSNLTVLLMLAAVLAGRLTRVWVARRRGSAGSRLHIRLVLLFSVIAAIPTVTVGAFATAWFSLGVQVWFSDRIHVALEEGLQASQGYLSEHRETIRADALAMKGDLERAGRLLASSPETFIQLLQNQTALRGLDQAVIYEPISGEVLASAGLMAAVGVGQIPPAAVEAARTGEVPVLGSNGETEVRAIVQLASTPPLMLVIERAVDPHILDHMRKTETAVEEYERVDANRSGLQVTFALIFALVALLVLAAAVLIGLVLANQIARPVGELMQAAERVRGGDLAVRVAETQSEDELNALSRAFNRMTGQLGAQRTELMDAYAQIDERRRFTEAVLAGVSAGVIGLDAMGRIELPNRAASELLGSDLLAALGSRLDTVVPEMGALLAEAIASPPAQHTAEIETGPARARRRLHVRLAPELKAGRVEGYVVTFDDVTELEAAQRKAAWADVARRIAHEIKNPLTPIQLSAERLKRRFAREITSDPETFTQCADTIVRHVGDIGRMVDEFSAFARMPQPQMRREDLSRILREALVLQKTAHASIRFDTTAIPPAGPYADCDRRLLGQALTNLLQNAADAIAQARDKAAPQAADPDSADTASPPSPPPAEPAGHIWISLTVEGDDALIRIADDGIGLPDADRARLTDPYVTHKPKGTGLGLAIVKKIMEDHQGSITLDDRRDADGAPAPGAAVTLRLPARDAAGTTS